MRENGSDPSAQGGGIQDANDQQEILKNDKSCVTPPIRAPDKHMDTKQNLEQQAKHAMVRLRVCLFLFPVGTLYDITLQKATLAAIMPFMFYIFTLYC